MERKDYVDKQPAMTMDKKPNGKSQLIFIGTWTAEKIGSEV